MVMTNIEHRIMEHLLRGSGEVLGALRGCLPTLSVSSRSFSGTGFFAEFSYRREGLPIPVRDFEIADVEGSSPQLERGFGVVLFIKAGRPDTLEVFTYEESWPQDLSVMSLYYTGGGEARNFDCFKFPT
jgi:hypothetical protein